MPSSESIQRSLYAVWRLMIGKPDGLKLLDLSADGFWDSFFAILVAFPALFIGWLLSANDLVVGVPSGGERFSLIVRLALIDLAVWILPIAGFLAVAKRAGVSDRAVQFVVAYNWGEALFAWITLPPALLFLVWNPEREISDAIMLLVFIALTVLSWRLVNTAINKGPAIGTAVFAGVFVASVVVLIALESVLNVFPSQI